MTNTEKPELVWDDEGVTEYKGFRYKRITVPDARAVQYDVPLYFSSRASVWASIVTPEERRQGGVGGGGLLGRD